MTGNTSGGGARKTLGVTLVATNRLMGTIQRKVCCRVVVEPARFPSRIRMTGLTFGAESCRRMRGIRRRVEIFLVTRHTSCGRPHKPLCMALVAVQAQMPALQRKTRGQVVVEGRVAPIFPIVTHSAVSRKLRSGMGRVGRCIIVLQMTRNAFGTHRLESQSRTGFVTLVTIQACMPTFQRKSSQSVYLRNLANHPRRRIVATITILTHRSLMHIVVARCTIRFGICKLQCRMTCFTRYFLVLPVQFKSCCVMVETLILDLPILGRMTDITTDLQSITMRRLPRHKC